MGSVTTTTRQRLLPYRVLAYLLYAKERTWVSTVQAGQVRIITGAAARFFRMKITVLWETLYWLEKNKLIISVEKERKRGSVIINLKSPEVFAHGEGYEVDDEH